jgi:hypothetical protein
MARGYRLSQQPPTCPPQRDGAPVSEARPPATNRSAHCPFVQVPYNKLRCYAGFFRGENMGVVTEILDLRQHKFSSVAVLLSALERIHDAPKEKYPLREFAAIELADIVLTNVAAHAAEAMHGQTTIRRARRVVMRFRRKFRGPGPERCQTKFSPWFNAGRFVGCLNVPTAVLQFAIPESTRLHLSRNQPAIVGCPDALRWP